MIALKPLGKSGINVSEIAFGCMSLGQDHGDNKKLLHRALREGICYFDTADIYQDGFNEETVGRALKDVRKQVIIATKVGNQRRPDGTLDWNPTKPYILKAVDASLKRLQTDYIDLYQLHGGTIDDAIDETIEAFETLKQLGKIREYGISSIRPNVIREYVQRSSIASVMMQYSLLDRRPEEACLSLLEQNNISVVVRGSVAGGLLLDKAPKAYLNYTAEQVAEVSETLSTLASPQRNKTALALGFVLNPSAVTSAVVGIRSPEQLQDVLLAYPVSQLSKDERNALEKILPQNYYEQHR